MMGMTAKIATGRRRLERLTEEFRADDNGATAIEYSLIVSLIFLAIMAAVRSVSATTSDNYDTITTTLSGATSP